MTTIDVLFGFVDAVDTVSRTGDVWGPVLLCTGLAVGLWRIRPRDGRHRTPSARWASARTTARTAVRTVAGTVHTAASALVRPTPDVRPVDADAPPVTSEDSRPAVLADGRPPSGGREDGSD
ncbi:hypothetical protein [Streptomyces sp. NPDC088847]|uniref:hypothetical protein n=1 Tax=Streptomyces sp. NPDC088847 TaxID=3365909 RepID=UPI0037F86463